MEDFQKFKSITNSYSDKFIHMIEGNNLSGGEWVAVEKIHGSNYSYWYDGHLAKNARREGFLGKDENFFGNARVAKYWPKIEEIYQTLLSDGMLENEDTLVVRGELFGGGFFGRKDCEYKSVQSSMNYHPDIEFAAFNIEILPIDGDSYTLTYDELLEYAVGRIPVCPEVGRGSLADMLKLNNDDPSRVPVMFGLDIPEGKVPKSEGLVIAPVDGLYFIGESMCMLKNKNDSFQEKNKSPKAPVEPMSESEVSAHMELSTYITESRLESVVSKEGEPTWKDFGKLSGLLVQDALVDFGQDTPSKRVMKSIHEISMSIVRNYLRGKA